MFLYEVASNQQKKKKLNKELSLHRFPNKKPDDPTTGVLIYRVKTVS
jgi:hypothetical protein